MKLYFYLPFAAALFISTSAHAISPIRKCVYILAVSLDKLHLLGPRRAEKIDILSKYSFQTDGNTMPNEYKAQFKADELPAMIRELAKESNVAAQKMGQYFQEYTFKPHVFNLEDIKSMRRIKKMAVRAGLTNYFMNGSSVNDIYHADALWSDNIIFKWFDDLFIRNRSLTTIESEMKELSALGIKNAFAIDQILYAISRLTHTDFRQDWPVDPNQYDKLTAWAQQNAGDQLIHKLARIKNKLFDMLDKPNAKLSLEQINFDDLAI